MESVPVDRGGDGGRQLGAEQSSSVLRPAEGSGEEFIVWLVNRVVHATEA